MNTHTVEDTLKPDRFNEDYIQKLWSSISFRLRAAASDDKLWILVKLSSPQILANWATYCADCAKCFAPEHISTKLAGKCNESAQNALSAILNNNTEKWLRREGTTPLKSLIQETEDAFIHSTIAIARTDRKIKRGTIEYTTAKGELKETFLFELVRMNEVPQTTKKN